MSTKLWRDWRIPEELARGLGLEESFYGGYRLKGDEYALLLRMGRVPASLLEWTYDKESYASGPEFQEFLRLVIEGEEPQPCYMRELLKVEMRDLDACLPPIDEEGKEELKAKIGEILGHVYGSSTEGSYNGDRWWIINGMF